MLVNIQLQNIDGAIFRNAQNQGTETYNGSQYKFVLSFLCVVSHRLLKSKLNSMV
jgi:hypothetical protein